MEATDVDSPPRSPFDFSQNRHRPDSPGLETAVSVHARDSGSNSGDNCLTGVSGLHTPESPPPSEPAMQDQSWTCIFIICMVFGTRIRHRLENVTDKEH